MGRIPLATLIFIAFISCIGYGQASKPNKATEIQFSQALSSTISVEAKSTKTDCPASFDSKIPWLKDLAVSQSGGRIPIELFKTITLNYPFDRPDPYAILPSGSIAFYGSKCIGVINPDGVLKWKLSLSDFAGKDAVSVVFIVTDMDETFYVSVCSKDREQPQEIFGFNENGDSVGKWIWPVADLYGPKNIKYDSGWLIADLSDTRRMSIKVKSDAINKIEQIVTSYDLIAYTGGFKVRLATGKMKNDKSKSLGILSEEKKRLSRTLALIKRKHNLSGLPFAKYEKRFAGSDLTGISGGDNAKLVDWDPHTNEAVVLLNILNPQGASLDDITNKETPAERNRPILVWFDSIGNVASYLILEKNQNYELLGNHIVLISFKEMQIWNRLSQ
jgi:hypothetical protein